MALVPPRELFFLKSKSSFFQILIDWSIGETNSADKKSGSSAAGGLGAKFSEDLHRPSAAKFASILPKGGDF